MKAKLNDHLQKLGKHKFLKLAAASLFLSDLLTIYYLTSSYFPRTLPSLLATSVRLQGGDLRYLGPEALQEVSALMTSSMQIMLTVFMLFHTLVYFLLTKEKKFAVGYARGYSILGVLLTLVMLPGMMRLGDYGWTVIMFLTTFLYGSIWYGLLYFRPKN